MRMVVFALVLASVQLQIGTVLFAQVLPLPTGEVTNLFPEDGAILCKHKYDKSMATGEVTNNYGNKAIRARIVIQVVRKKPGNVWEAVDSKISTPVLVDSTSTETVSASCGEGLSEGNYQVKVWLQWQDIDKNKEIWDDWHNLQSPSPPYSDTNSGEVVDENTQHAFTIYNCAHIPENVRPVD